MTHDVLTHDVLTHGVLTHDVLTHDVLTHDVLTHDVLTHDACVRVEQSYHQPGWRRSMEELQRVLDTQVLTCVRLKHSHNITIVIFTTTSNIFSSCFSSFHKTNINIPFSVFKFICLSLKLEFCF